MIQLQAHLLAAVLLAVSPWWEDYSSKDTYLCRDKAQVVLERNEAQAALSSGGQRTTLFRRDQEQSGLIYGNETLRLIVRGDELTLEQRARQVLCLRMEQV